MTHSRGLKRGLCRLLLLTLALEALAPAPALSAAKPKSKSESHSAAVLQPQKAASEDVFDDPDLEKERAIGRRALEEIERQWPLESNPAAIARLTMILNRLEPHMQRRIPYEIRLVKTEALNAFCLPGGFIFFTSGLLDLLNTDSEIAAVMAHEMSHADRKHSLRMAAEANKVSLAALAVMLLSGGAGAPIILAQVAQLAITNAYSIELETEADHLGLEALIASGYYSPTGMVTLIEKFMDQDLRQPIRDYGIYMDHPTSKRRLEAVLKTLRERGIPVRRKYPLGLLRTSFQETKDRIDLTVDGLPVWGGKKALATREALTKAREALDAHLQLELPPYDLHLVGDALYVGNHLLASPTEGMDGVDGFREKLLVALNAARRKSPSAKYFQ